MPKSDARKTFSIAAWLSMATCPTGCPLLSKVRAPTAGSALLAFCKEDSYAIRFEPTARLQERDSKTHDPAMQRKQAVRSALEAPGAPDALGPLTLPP